MAWKKAAGRCYSPEQREKMVQMVLKDNKTITEVAKTVGCHLSTLWCMVQRAKNGELNKKPVSVDVESSPLGFNPFTLPIKPTKQDLATLAEKYPVTVQVTDKDTAKENEYLRWAITGALSKVGDVTFIDRLIDEFRSGKLR